MLAQSAFDSHSHETDEEMGRRQWVAVGWGGSHYSSLNSLLSPLSHSTVPRCHISLLMTNISRRASFHFATLTFQLFFLSLTPTSFSSPFNSFTFVFDLCGFSYVVFLFLTLLAALMMMIFTLIKSLQFFVVFHRTCARTLTLMYSVSHSGNSSCRVDVAALIFLSLDARYIS